MVTPEVPEVDKLLQRLMTDTQSRPLPVVNHPAPTELEQSMCPFLAEQHRRRRQPCSGQVVTATGDGDTELSTTDRIRTVDMLVHRGTVEKLLQRQSMRPFLAEQHRRRRPPRRRLPARRDWSDVWEVGSCSNTMPEFEWLISVYATRMTDIEDAWWICYDPTSGGNGPPAGGKRRLIREGGTRLSGQGSCSAPGPRRGSSVDCFPTTDDNWWRFSDCRTVRRGTSVDPPGVSTEWTEIMAEDTSKRECPHDDIGIRWRAGTIEMSEDWVPTKNIESPYGGGVRSLPGATRSLLPVKFSAAPVLLADGPQ